MAVPDKKLYIENIGDMPLGAGEYTGVYAGSAFCQEALPDPAEMLALASVALERGLSFHLITPYLTERHFSRAAVLADALAKAAPGSEVITNDLGFLATLASEYPALIPVAGTILAFQRTDPQVPEIINAAFGGAELERKRDSLRSVSVSNPIFAQFLKERRVSRLEVQNPVQGVLLNAAGFSFTLHIPYVYVATSRFCQPMERLTRPGRVPGVYNCLRQCKSCFFRIKPHGSDMQFIFRGNTIYYENPSVAIPPEVDRVVVHKRPS
jgi:hypothetical protein